MWEMYRGTEECIVSGEKVVCVNCWGAHVAGDRRCPVQEREVEVTRSSEESREGWMKGEGF